MSARLRESKSMLHVGSVGRGEMIADDPDKLEKPEKPLVTFEGESEANRIVQEPTPEPAQKMTDFFIIF